MTYILFGLVFIGVIIVIGSFTVALYNSSQIKDNSEQIKKLSHEVLKVVLRLNDENYKLWKKKEKVEKQLKHIKKSSKLKK